MTSGGGLSRAARHKKRQNNRQKILFFSSLAIVFCIILFALIAFGNREMPKQDRAGDDDGLRTELKKMTSQVEKDPDEGMEKADGVDTRPGVTEITIVDSTDENVIEAFIGNWEPIGTIQVGTHTTNYQDGSDDRKEIKKAVSIATGIAENNITEHWIGNNGEQKVVATIQDQVNGDYFRAYLTWVNNEGWQVTLVEKIRKFNHSVQTATGGNGEE